MEQASAGVPYHQLARENGRARAVAELVLVGLFTLVFGGIAGAIIGSLAGNGDVTELDGAWGLLALCSMIATLLPASLLAARVMGRRPGYVSSVSGRLRWRVLASYIPVSLALLVALVAAELIYALVTGDTGETTTKDLAWPGLGEFLPLLVLVLAIVPIQAAAEEYAFRGTLMQVIGAWTRSPWIAIGITGIVFAAAHALPLQGFIVLAITGLVAGWVTVRTGGLEAAIAIHAVNNVVLFSLVAASGQATTWVSSLNTEIGWPEVVFQGAAELAFAWFVARRTSAQRAAAAADQVVQDAAERSRGVEHADHGGGAEALAPQQQEIGREV